MSTPAATDHPAVVKKLSALDRMLPVWIGRRHGRRTAARPADPRTR